MKKATAIILTICILLTFACKRTTASQEDLSVLVFITGVIAGSPNYELMAEGALEFADKNPNVKIKIYEAGMNQGEWESQLGEMVSSGQYDIVLGSNPSLPQICENVFKMFPDQKFIITDAYHEGNPNIKTYFYPQYEQSLFLGYLAGLVTTSSMDNANNHKRVGFIAAQEYPLLTKQMVPGFIAGAKMVDPLIELDFRVVGSWGDPSKAAQLASAMIETGVDVFTVIAGGSSSGVISTVQNRGAYIVWHNTNGYELSPLLVVGSGFLEQKKLVMEILSSAIHGNIEYGSSTTLGVKEGYIRFIFDDPLYTESLPVDIREKFETFMDELIAGRINYTIPSL